MYYAYSACIVISYIVSPTKHVFSSLNDRTGLQSGNSPSQPVKSAEPLPVLSQRAGRLVCTAAVSVHTCRCYLHVEIQVTISI